jgi:hypothetical protein
MRIMVQRLPALLAGLADAGRLRIVGLADGAPMCTKRLGQGVCGEDARVVFLPDGPVRCVRCAYPHARHVAGRPA